MEKLVVEKDVSQKNCYVIMRPDGSCTCLTWDEMKAVEEFFIKRKQRIKIEDQVGYDEDSLDFTGDISREDFIDLCMEDIESRREIYGADFEPDPADVVFDVAHDNEIWRD